MRPRRAQSLYQSPRFRTRESAGTRRAGALARVLSAKESAQSHQRCGNLGDGGCAVGEAQVAGPGLAEGAAGDELHAGLGDQAAG